MKKLMTLFASVILLMCYTNKCIAQYVTIPDAKFVNWLYANIPAAMSGSQMDTTHSSVTSRTSINVENDSIYDLTGIQYFSSLVTLDCGNGIYAITPNRLKSIPALPATLDTLICGRNLLDSLPALPTHLRVLKCYENPLHQLPALPSTLTYLECYSDSLTNLPALSASLYFLNCGFNSLDSLPVLPLSLQTLYCNMDSLTLLPSLPSTLSFLDCGRNFLQNLPALPNSLGWLNCEANQLTTLLLLPNSLGYLNCSYNSLTNLPALPPSLYWLSCGQNQLSVLSSLPGSLQFLYCDNNLLTNLPSLPNFLGYLHCSNNLLTTLPALPGSLQDLYCYSNQLSGLPTLPNSLVWLNCSNNNISCFLVFPSSIMVLNLYNNPFNCLPNYLQYMDSVTLAFPLCSSVNSNGCVPAQGIVGFTYKDNNSSCTKDAGDGKLKNIPIELYDNSNNFIAKTFTALNGVYNFPEPAGTYTVTIDTLAVPFMSTCTYPGLDSVVTTTLLDTNINFSLACKPGFDIGIQSVSTFGALIFPGMNHELNTIAGDMTHWYNLNCAAGISGQVEITVTGNVNYVGPAPGALIPSVSGNVYTFNIADFALVNNETDFNLIFQTITTAQAGDMICATVSVTPTSGDNDTLNNTFSYCYYVVNSHDPNTKEVYPINVSNGYMDWFTYTIHFQNTGNAPAMNIRITDTLDANLDMSTFQEINYSHNNTALLSGNVLTVNFPNINLSDSATNAAASMGFVQYRVKPKANVLIDTKIYNRAYIYFDYNEPIVTNNVVSTYLDFIPTSENEMIKEKEFHVFPNPSSDFINIDYEVEKAEVQIEIIDITGRKILSTYQRQINISKLPQGLYLLKILDGDLIFSNRFIKE